MISIADIIIKTIIIAIVETIGPIAFSTRDDKRKARDATTIMLKEANEYPNKNLQRISYLGKIIMLELLMTINSPTPKIRIPRPRLIIASQSTNKFV